VKDERDCAVIGSSADACLKDVKRKIMTLCVNDTESEFRVALSQSGRIVISAIEIAAGCPKISSAAEKGP
jgi:hypothetical protein